MSIARRHLEKTKSLIAPWPDAHWRLTARRRLLRWFAAHQRDLPWRKTRDPYSIWISEIMLQQTQVATVIPYYQRFLEALPTVRDLAAASEQDVLLLWEGLGYYRRARQLHRAAHVIVGEHYGDFPSRLSEIEKLPGIGRYTAGAIASIAFDQQAPILEANTVRLYSRLLGLRDRPDAPAGQATLWRFAAQIVPRQGAGALNQALMELGSLICTPTSPRCDQCPLRPQCAAAVHGLQDTIPAAKLRPVVEEVREATVIVWHRDRILLRQRESGERWAGMWDFPRFSLVATNGDLNQALIGEVTKQTGVKARLLGHLTTIKHGVTRFRITLECYEARCTKPAPVNTRSQSLRWLLPEDLHSVPLSVPARKLARLIAERSKTN